MFHIQHHERVGSTSDEAKLLAASGAPHGPWCMPTSRSRDAGGSAGPGTARRGTCICRSCCGWICRSRTAPELSFVAALTVADTVDALLPKQTRSTLKWPNDVLVNEGKIAGILVESVDGAHIIGIGLNVLEAPRNAPYKTSTLVGAGGIATVDGARDILLDSLAKHLDPLDRGRVRPDPRCVAGARASDR